MFQRRRKMRTVGTEEYIYKMHFIPWGVKLRVVTAYGMYGTVSATWRHSTVYGIINGQKYTVIRYFPLYIQEGKKCCCFCTYILKAQKKFGKEVEDVSEIFADSSDLRAIHNLAKLHLQSLQGTRMNYNYYSLADISHN